MANITGIEPIRYGQHALTSDASGLIIVPESLGLDYSLATTVAGFTVVGSAPDNTARAVAFRLDGEWVKLDSGGVPAALPTQSLTVESLLAEGNAPEDLATIASVPAFAGKQIGLSYALWAEDPEGEMPSISVKGNAVSNQTVLVKEETSPEYALGGVMKSVTAQTSATGVGSAVVLARTSIDGGETWSDWGDPDDLVDAEIGTIQFKATLTVATPNSDTAGIAKLTLVYTPADAGSVSEVGTVSIVSLTEDWHDDLSVCNMTLYHSPLVNAALRAYVAFRNESTYATQEVVGTGTGAAQTYSFGHPNGIKLDTVQAFANGAQVYSSTVDTVAGTITLTADAGAIVTVNYEYGWEEEDWKPMTLAETRPSADGRAQSQFVYSIPQEELGSQTVAAIKIELETKEGSISGETVGVGTGAAKSYMLSHYIKDQSITLFANGQNVPPGNWFISDVDARIVTVLGPAGATITANYDWISESPVVYKYIAMFA
jgi:hypothetical protein